MHLSSFLILNYKSCKIIQFAAQPNQPNIFIGLNDAGKSSLLKGLDIHFNKSQCSFNKEGNNKSDLSNSPLSQTEVNAEFDRLGYPTLHNYEENSIVTISELVFTEEELEDFITKDLTPLLSWALEKAEDKKIYICKVISQTKSLTYLKVKCNEDDEDIFTHNATNLNRLITRYEISPEEITNANNSGRFSNLEKIRAILLKTELRDTWIEYKSGKSDSDIFPVFEYFDWNTSMEEITSIANSLMKDKIAEFIMPVKESAINAATEAETAINEEFGKLQEIISSVAPEIKAIKSNVYFDVKEKISDIMVEKMDSDSLIHLENQGDGIKRKIWFSLIKSKASNSSTSNLKNYIWAFDEPETHLHPSAQRDFFDILKDLSNGNVQTFVGTHSTIFIDKSESNKISSISKDGNGYSILSNCLDVESIYTSLGLKNSDFLFFDKFLIVEGETEQYLIPAFYQLYTGNTVIDDNIQIINIGGKDKWREAKQLINKIMADFRKSDAYTIYLFDNDMSFEMAGNDIIPGKFFFVGKQDIEDAIDDDVWVEIINTFYKYYEFSVDKNFISLIKNSIPENSRINSNQKYFRKLNTELRKKWIEEKGEEHAFLHLPDKGQESAKEILRSLNKPALIPENIRNCFDVLKTL